MSARPIPIINEQRRLVEVGRIRLGKKVPMGNGRSRPAKIDKFRLTSRDKARLDAAALLYGGTVTEWESQWELYTDSDAIPIAVVPTQALSVYYELWGQKSLGGDKKTPVICLRRCDGELETKSDGPCLCAGEEEMTCRPTVRLSVVLPDVPGMGVWRLESHGWNAASELQGTVELLEALVATGRPVRARLRLDKRESPSEQGTRKFVVPVIDIDHTLSEVLDSLSTGQPMAEAVEVGSRFAPVPALPAAPRASIADQVATAHEPKERPARANAQEPIRATGLVPRAVADLSPRELNTALRVAGIELGGTPDEMRARLADHAPQTEGAGERPPVGEGESTDDGDAPEGERSEAPATESATLSANGHAVTASPASEGSDPETAPCARCGSTRTKRIVVDDAVVCEIISACRARAEQNVGAEHASA